MPLYLFYTMVQKSQKWPKTQIKGGGGPALIFVLSNWPEKVKTRSGDRKACKPGGRKFGMEINFIHISILRKLRN